MKTKAGNGERREGTCDHGLLAQKVAASKTSDELSWRVSDEENKKTFWVFLVLACTLVRV